MFRNIGDIQSITPDGGVARCVGHRVPELGPAPQLGDPIALDAATLPGALAAAIYAGEQRPFYFSKIQSLRFYASWAGSTELWLCRFTRERPGRKVPARVEILDREGRVAVRMEIKGVPSAEPVPAAPLTGQVWQTLREHPRQLRIRELLGLPAGSLQFAQVDLRLLDSALAGNAEDVLEWFLGSEERLEWNSLTHSKRRREWLGGRIAAKTGLQMLLDPATPANKMRIRNSEDDRRPVAEFEGQPEGPPPSISIAHSRDVAVALASKAAGFGVDVETVSGSAEELLPGFAAREEAQAFGAAFPSSPEAFTLLWAAKEACRKALGARKVAAHEIHLREMRKVDEYGVAVFDRPGGEIWCAVFVENDYAWAAAYSGGAA